MKNKQPVIAIIDVGKTNKKLFLFDADYNIVYERSARFTETVDEDGDPCENIESLRLSVFDSLRHVFNKRDYCIKAVNFSTYGASFVYLDEDGVPLTPLYNYLKAYPQRLREQFYNRYGGEEAFFATHRLAGAGQPQFGMQLYRIKWEKTRAFRADKTRPAPAPIPELSFVRKTLHRHHQRRLPYQPLGLWSRRLSSLGEGRRVG